MSEYRQKIEGFVWPACLKPLVRYLARDSAGSDDTGSWFGFVDEPKIRGGCWYRSGSDDEYYGFDFSLLVLPEGREPLLLCRDDYVTDSETATPGVTAMEKALRKISRIANARLAPIEQDAALEIIASECYEVLGE